MIAIRSKPQALAQTPGPRPIIETNRLVLSAAPDERTRMRSRPR